MKRKIIPAPVLRLRAKQIERDKVIPARVTQIVPDGRFSFAHRELSPSAWQRRRASPSTRQGRLEKMASKTLTEFRRGLSAAQRAADLGRTVVVVARNGTRYVFSREIRASALESIKQGLAESAAGKTIYRGSFAKHAKANITRAH